MSKPQTEVKIVEGHRSRYQNREHGAPEVVGGAALRASYQQERAELMKSLHAKQAQRLFRSLGGKGRFIDETNPDLLK